MTQCEVTINRMAHGGKGIGHAEGRTIFVDGAYPGDTVVADLYKEKKKIAFGRVQQVLQPSPHRLAARCAAAAAGAGCCDFATLDPAAELDIKKAVLADQLYRLAGLADLPNTRTHDLQPNIGWRTRVRMHVDADGAVGFKAAHGNEIIANIDCAQVHPQLMQAIRTMSAQTQLTPLAEVVGVIDDASEIHIVEVARAARGRRSERILKVLQGQSTAIQKASPVEFKIPVTAFWQAHTKAVATFSELITQALEEFEVPDQAVVWDLYGGCGAFVPAIARAVSAAHIIEIDHATQAIATGMESFAKLATEAGKTHCSEVALEQPVARLEFHAKPVAKLIQQLPKPAAVILDPPRTGAGAEVIADIAQTQCPLIIHFGCDAATFARDVQSWHEQGYRLERLEICNAFPGTHHFETIGIFRRD